MMQAHERYLQSLSQVSINYFFYGFYFFLAMGIHVYHVSLIESFFSFSFCFFLVYAIGQCAIETLLLILFANAIRIFFRAKGFMLYGLVVFFLLLTHVIDFPLVRFMDMSFWYALNFISQESSQNFLELLYASNVSILIWLVSGIAGCALLIAGMLSYQLTERWASQRPLIVPYSLLAASLCTLCLFLMSWDYSTQKFVPRTQFDLYQKTLPWKSTFFHQHQEYYSLAHSLQEPTPQEERWNLVGDADLEVKNKPDIYLFIAESLREDFINEDNAPHLNAFKNQFVSFDLGLSNANATHISWFSLFYSQFPLYWGQVTPENWKGGSLPLQLFKKMGYQINVYSSSRLSYYQMDRLIFGEDNHLVDIMVNFDDEQKAPHERDQYVVEQMIHQMKDSQESGGRVFIVFLDSTHLDYSWPEKTHSAFQPYEKKINYLKAAFTNAGLEKIKNRYKNALSFVDSLFGNFLQALASSPGGDEAVVVFTGDHGEEFYEQGHLFHASSLSHPQTHVPLYYKFGKMDPSVEQRERQMSCHMDIFPTLFHYVSKRDLGQGWCEGQSIFNQQRWPYTIIARFNASRSPCEFCIHNGIYKLTASFSDERNIFNSRGLRILSMKNLKDDSSVHYHKLKEQFGEALDRIFNR